ncbi:putative Pfs NB-ARC and ankyrin-domain-containing protein [Fusarium oxysporum]|nr:putative Pfs NB-ARC and ankyrin-domain-containing protein [Fusarium oxysporum]
MDGREVKIDDAAEGTCKWLLNHKTLIEWTRQNRGLLWIKGKPGSGKSTLMKYALDALPSIYGTDTLAISFFFHGRGHELQKTLLGLFRSLLHQLLCRVPGALPDLIENFEEKSKTVGEHGEKWQWHLQPLQAFLKLSLPRILRRFPVILFIDALDECGEQSAVELIGHLKHLLSSLPPTGSRFGIIFSCRHYPILELDGGLTILLDTENNADITTYVQDRFSTDPDHYIESLISDRAQGVFMWAHLVVERVLRMKRRREPRVEIEAAITQTPQNLDDLYHGLIQDVENRSVTLKLMQWICFSTRPLTASELRWAMAVDPNQTYKSLDECQGSKDFINDDDIDTRVMVLSCGLAEIVPSNNARIVQFIHQSVKDFFVERGLMALDNSTKEANLVVPVAHCRLSRTCIHYFRMAAHSHSQPFSQPDTFKFPFVRYAMKSLMSHIVLGKVAETSPRGLLDLLGWPRDSLIELWVHTYRQMEPVTADCPRSGTKLIHVISRYGLTKLASFLLQDCGEIGALNVQDSWGRTPLSWAAENGNEAVVKMLLDTGKADVDSRDENGQSPLSWAAENGHEAVVKILLDTGKADVDSRDKNGRSPLLWAAEKGRNGKYGGMPLSWAADGNEAVVRLLLDTGKVDMAAEDLCGLTASQFAYFNHHTMIDDLLLARGAPTIPDFYGLQALFTEPSSTI